MIISLNLTRDSLNFIYVKPDLMLELGNQESYSQLYEYVAASIHPEHLEEFCRRFSAENLNKTLGQEKNEVFLDVRQMETAGITGFLCRSFMWTIPIPGINWQS